MADVVHEVPIEASIFLAFPASLASAGGGSIELCVCGPGDNLIGRWVQVPLASIAGAEPDEGDGHRWMHLEPGAFSAGPEVPWAEVAFAIIGTRPSRA